MTQDKNLLLKYLCMALPYNTQISIADNRFQCYGIHLNWRLIGEIEKYDAWNNIKPYLRPMSSMTEEEKEEMHNLLSPEGTAIYGCSGISMPINHYGEFVPYEFMNRIIQYLLKNHFDFMGLIPKDLAIEVTKENNPYK